MREIVIIGSIGIAREDRFSNQDINTKSYVVIFHKYFFRAVRIHKSLMESWT